jgi:hypothetical protein
MDEEELTPEQLHNIVQSAVNPQAHYRRSICRRLAKQTYNQFGVEGLFDMLSGIDDAGRFSSIVLAERDEIENYLFHQHGVFDQDIYEKVILSEEWDSLLEDVLELVGKRVASIVDSLVETD